MIDEAAIMTVIGGAVLQSELFPRIAWANKDAVPALPYLVLSLEPLAIDDATLGQTDPHWRGFVQAAVVRDLDEFETAGLADRKALAELFPSGTRFPLGDGTAVLINGHPQTQRPYRDGPTYRFPLRIDIKSE